MSIANRKRLSTEFVRSVFNTQKENDLFITKVFSEHTGFNFLVVENYEFVIMNTGFM